MKKVLLIKTDQEEATVALAQDTEIIDTHIWKAGRELSMTLNKNIEDLCKKNNFEIKDINAVVFFSGHGSFTGLRIGASVANTLAYALQIPIVEQTGDHWQEKGLAKIKSGDNDKIVKINYGSGPNITTPRK